MLAACAKTCGTGFLFMSLMSTMFTIIGVENKMAKLLSRWKYWLGKCPGTAGADIIPSVAYSFIRQLRGRSSLVKFITLSNGDAW